jgi:hypothetical protein
MVQRAGGTTVSSRLAEARPFMLAAMAAAALFVTCLASAADLKGVSRSIRKQPEYRSQPKYCLLVFGASVEDRVWLVLDGDTLYVDRNGNGDLTEPGERIQSPAFSASDHPAHQRERSIETGDLSFNGFTHTGLVVHQTEYRRKVETFRGVGLTSAQDWQSYLDSIWSCVPDGIVFSISLNLDVRCYSQFAKAERARVHHFAWIDQQGQLTFADRPDAAPVVHFGGPITFRVSPSQKLPHGAHGEKLTVFLGSAGLGPGTFATMSYDLVPKDVHPAVEVRFPTKESAQEPLVRRYVLKDRC